MNILGRLALLFIVVPILELMLLIQLGQVVGLLPTLALVVFTGVTGAWLARAEGLRVFLQFQRELASGKLPGQALMDGICVLVGGAFLLTPGVLTDLAGFSLLFPPTRRWMQRRIRKRLEHQIADGTVRVVTMGSFGGGGMADDEAPDGTVEIGRRPRTGDAGGRRDPPRGMDPSKQIVIDEEWAGLQLPGHQEPPR
jgi:UPF0716 protein FxsA